MIQIGNDGGLLPQAVALPNTPVGLVSKAPDWLDPLMGDPVNAGISTTTLFLAPGERADVIVDFSQVPRGSKLILYNDAPAPAPIGDSRVDYYTGDPDLRLDRRCAQHRRRLRTEHAHDPAVPGRRRRCAALRPRTTAGAALPAAFAASQDPILVPAAAYDAAYEAVDDAAAAAQLPAREGRHARRSRRWAAATR